VVRFDVFDGVAQVILHALSVGWLHPTDSPGAIHE
jgi:hypothetical protein